MERLPAPIVGILQQQQLKVIRVFRDGPRFWVGQVERGDQTLVLKAVINDEAWVSPRTGDVFRPSDQLRNEIVMARILEGSASRLAGPVPAVIETHAQEPTWLLRTYTYGLSMAAGPSPFLFKDAFYLPEHWRAVLDFVLSFQAVTPLFVEHRPHFADSPYSKMAEKLAITHLERPTEPLEPYARSVGAWLTQRAILHDGSRDTLSHGQVFPPHMIVSGGRASLIDWENASVSNRFQDLVSMWVRGFARPSWQKAFYSELEDRGLIATDLDRELWRTEVMLQSAGNLNYFFWSRNELPEQQHDAISALRANIECLLTDSQLVGQ